MNTAILADPGGLDRVPAHTHGCLAPSIFLAELQRVVQTQDEDDHDYGGGEKERQKPAPKKLEECARKIDFSNINCGLLERVSAIS